MVGGISLIGIVTATLASWIVERVTGQAQSEAAATESQIAELRGEIGEPKDLVRQLQPTTRD